MTSLRHKWSSIASHPLQKGVKLDGTIRVPGDKSISHRSVMLAALADGESNITGLLEGEDVLATLAAFRAMGVQFVGPTDGKLGVKGVGVHGLREANGALDMGNSGTAMRLMSGILAAQSFPSMLIGDESLSKRPMGRVTLPLSEMGANCQVNEAGCPPITIKPTQNLTAIHYPLPVASAQIKSAILLAGLYAQGITEVVEPAPTRDHTERMLNAFDYPCNVVSLGDGASKISLEGCGRLKATNIEVPADISSAAFFMVAASIIPDSHLLLEHVGINPTRTGIIQILRDMEADIELHNERQVGGEPVADIEVRSQPLKGVEINPDLVPLAIDEFPIICIAAACASGETRISAAEELRHKESDRITTMAKGLTAVGITVEEFNDGMLIKGGRISGGRVDSKHDHRIAMAFAIAGAVAEDVIEVEGWQAVATSFPYFEALANDNGLELK